MPRSKFPRLFVEMQSPRMIAPTRRACNRWSSPRCAINWLILFEIPPTVITTKASAGGWRRVGWMAQTEKNFCDDLLWPERPVNQEGKPPSLLNSCIRSYKRSSSANFVFNR